MPDDINQLPQQPVQPQPVTTNQPIVAPVQTQAIQNTGALPVQQVGRVVDSTVPNPMPGAGVNSSTLESQRTTFRVAQSLTPVAAKKPSRLASLLGVNNRTGQPRVWRIMGMAVVPFIVLVILLLGLLFWKLSDSNDTTADGSSSSTQTAIAKINLSELTELPQAVLDISDTSQLIVNGELYINGAFVLSAGKVPANPKEGSVYFDPLNKEVKYYDGDDFVSLAEDDNICYIGADCGFLTVLPQDLTTTATPTFTGVVIGVDTVTDIAGTGLALAGGVLRTVLGTTIDSLEIIDGAIQEVDLEVTNTATDNFALTYDAGTGGFTWVDPITFGTDNQNVFQTFTTPNGTSPVADNPTDTLSFADGSNINITGASGTDTITIAVTDSPTFAGNVAIQGNTTLGNATTNRLTVTSQLLGTSPLVFQGTTDNSFTTSFTFTDPTANRTITFPDTSGTVLLSGGSLFTITDGTTPQTILQGDTITYADGTDINVVTSATDTVTVNNTSTLATVTGRGATTTTLVNLNGGLAVDTANFTVSGTTGDVLTVGDIAVNGGDLTTSAATASLFNTNATVLSIGGVATTLELGAATGTTSVNNILVVDGDTSIGTTNSPATFNVNGDSALGTGASGTGSYLQAGNLGTADAWLDARGSGANVGLYLRTKGTGAAYLYNGNFIIGQAGVDNNYLQLTNATNSNLVSIRAKDATAAYALQLPTVAPGLNECLKGGGTTATDLVFANCATAGAPIDGEYVTYSSNATLSNERVFANGTNTTVDLATGGQIQIDVVNSPSFSGSLTVAGLTTLNGGLTVQTGNTFTFNNDAFTDLTGTGLTISGGSLQTTLGTSISSSEIINDTIQEIDLEVTNATPTDNYALTYDNATSGFTWVDPSTFGTDNQNLFRTISVDSGTNPVADSSTDTLIVTSGNSLLVVSGISSPDTLTLTVDTTPTFSTVNTGQGAYELYAMNQDVLTTSAVTFTTINTGQGVNELYDMNQNVLTSSAVSFATINTGFGANELYDMNQHVLTSSAVSFATINTGLGANELYDMNQNVLTTSAVSFATINTGLGANELYDMNQNVLTTSAVTFNRLTAAKGAVNQPAFTFTGDTDTGINSNAVNTVNITSSSASIVSFRYSGGFTEMIFQNDLPVLTGATDVVITNSSKQLGRKESSIVYKKNVIDIEDHFGSGANPIFDVNPRYFEWKAEVIGNRRTQGGFIAEELRLLIPDAVNTTDEGVATSVDSAIVQAYLVAGVQEINLKVISHETRITNLDTKVQATELKVNDHASRITALEVALANPSFANLAVADTITTRNIVVNGHIIGAGNTPGVVSGASAGVGASVSISGSDTAGAVTLTPGAGPAVGEFIEVIFTSSYTSAPYVTVTPTNTSAAALDYFVTKTTTGFKIHTASSVLGASTVQFDYQVIE